MPTPTLPTKHYRLYRDMEIGIQMVYPGSWKAVKQDSSFVWVRIADEQDDSRLTLFTLFHDVDTPVSERLDEAASLFVEQEVEEGLEPEAELLGPVTLDDGSPASRADITHPGRKRHHIAQGPGRAAQFVHLCGNPCHPTGHSDGLGRGLRYNVG